MNNLIPEQLDKILAMADSSHESEAAVAVRKARQILAREGLSFSDLARAALTGQMTGKSSGHISLLSGQRDHLQTHIDYLQQQLVDVQAQLRTQDLQVDFWRRRARDLENAQNHAGVEAERWKKLARDTAEKLWDVGQNIRGEEFIAPMPMAQGRASQIIRADTSPLKSYRWVWLWQPLRPKILSTNQDFYATLWRGIPLALMSVSPMLGGWRKQPFGLWQPHPK